MQEHDTGAALDVLSALTATIPIYGLPSESLWRALELIAWRTIVRREGLEKPVLELGCGDGQFSALVLDDIALGIDNNPRALHRCQKVGASHRSVAVMDAQHLALSAGAYRSVVANCVIEHIADLPLVLSGVARVLALNGKLVVTVPLTRMNLHLALRPERYQRFRQRQLVHLNLLSEQEWMAILIRAGFRAVRFYPYLDGATCRFWDSLDLLAALGIGRIRLGGLYRAAWRMLPAPTRQKLVEPMARWLASRVPTDGAPVACAAAIVAVK